MKKRLFGMVSAVIAVLLLTSGAAFAADLPFPETEIEQNGFSAEIEMIHYTGSDIVDRNEGTPVTLGETVGYQLDPDTLDPAFDVAAIESTYWEVQDPSGASNAFIGKRNFLFCPDQEGEYKVTLVKADLAYDFQTINEEYVPTKSLDNVPVTCTTHTFTVKKYNETFTVTDFFGDEPVIESSETYEVKEDGIHIYSGSIFFSGETDQKIFVEYPAEEAHFTDMVIRNSVYVNTLSYNAIIHLNNSTIEGDVIAVMTEDSLYLSFNLENDNEIKGDVLSDDSVSLFGQSDASLSVKSIRARTMLYLENLRLQNMKENYVLGETLTATPADGTNPVVFIVKKEVVFPTEEEYIVHDGKPFAFGEEYDVTPPVICDENGVPLDPQPELTTIYYHQIDGSEWGWEIEMIEGKPTAEGSYYIAFFIPQSNPDYYGGELYPYAIGHGIKKDNGKPATTEAAGYKPYYYCEGCGKFYEDAEGTTEIADIEKWKAEGGSGYLPKLEEVTPQGGDGSMVLFLLSVIASLGLSVLTVCEKKKKSVR